MRPDKKTNKARKNYLKVPFSQKDIAKNLGAKWDRNKKKSWRGGGRKKLINGPELNPSTPI